VTRYISVGVVSIALAGRLLAQSLDSPGESRAGRPAAGHAATAAAAHRRPVISAMVFAQGAETAFEPNRGHLDPSIRYLASGPGYRIALTQTGASFHILRTSEGPSPSSPRRIDMTLVGSNPLAVIEGLEPRRARHNYFRGTNPSNWAVDVPLFGRVRYRNIYDGIDLIFYDKRGTLEHDFVVAPGADTSRIRLRFAGGQTPRLNRDGDVMLMNGGLRLGAPAVYQTVDNQKHSVPAQFITRGDEVSLRIGAYDRTKPLVVDPPILYGTYLGGLHDDNATALAVDDQGNSYVAGFAASEDYPVSANAYQPQRKNPGQYVWNVVLSKISSSGALLYSTYIGGSTGDWSTGVAVDPLGNAYVVGATQSSDFPVTPNGYPAGSFGTSTNGPGHVFLVKLNATGSALLYSTVIPGTLHQPVSASGNFSVAPTPNADYYVGIGGPSIALDDVGRVYVAGSAVSTLPAPFPTTPGAFMTQPPADHSSAAFIAIFDLLKSGTQSLVAATLYGANGGKNTANAIVLDAAGNPWITGTTYTNALATTSDAAQPSLPALDQSCKTRGTPSTGPLASAAYVARLSGDLTQLQYASYLSGQTRNIAGFSANCYEYGQSLSRDPAGNIYIGGVTGSDAFPVTPGVAQPSWPGSTGFFKYNNAVGFVSKLNPNGDTLLWSTYLGGNTGFNIVGRLAADQQGNVWAAGGTDGGANFPVTQDAFQPVNRGGFSDGFVTELSTDGTTVLYSTFLGGTKFDVLSAIALDAKGNLSLGGSTASLDMPVSANAFQTIFANGDIGPDGNDAYFASARLASLGDVGPAVGGNTGEVTVTIGGAGIQIGATCSLAHGASVIQAIVTSIAADGTSAVCTFDLSGAAVGPYDVVLRNPDSSVLSRTDAFTVDNGGKPELSVQIIGRSVIRTGVPSTFWVTVANTGTLDAYFVPLWITVPSDVTFSFAGYAQSSFSAIGGPTSEIGSMLPGLAAGQVVTFPLQITSPADSAGILITADLQAPWFRTRDAAAQGAAATSYAPGCALDPVNDAFSNCQGAYLAFALADDVPFDSAVQHAQGVAANQQVAAPSACEAGNSIADGHNDGLNDGAPDPPTYNQPEFTFDKLPYAFGYHMGFTEAQLNKLNQLPGKMFPNPAPQSWHYPTPPPPPPDPDGASCPAPQPPAPPSLPGGSRIMPRSGGSIDPNDKAGPSGDGSANHYIQPSVPLSYQVAFENQPTAALPAAEVVVTDQLDPAHLDLSTLTLGAITIGSHLIQVPPNVNHFDTLYALDPNLSVRIHGGVNVATGVLRYSFVSIDPTTQQPPSDPTVGFLPPDIDGVSGQGSFLFTVMPTPNQRTGTALANDAVIVFDANPPISTPVWINTVDASAPSSHVVALPAIEASSTFPVEWTGSDAGAGIVGVDLFVSDNGGSFVPFATDLSTPTATFNGEAGHAYAFYSVARDAAGNVEAGKAAGEASTQVAGSDSDSTPPVITPHVIGVVGNNGWYTSGVDITWDAADPESGIASSSGCDARTIASDTSGVSVTCFATNGAGLSNAATISIKIDSTPPLVHGLPAAPCTLWPPNMQLVQVASISAVDGQSGLASFDVIGTSSEPGGGEDVVITGAGLAARAVQLRAERLGNGKGRTYLVQATAVDLAGNGGLATASCVVPRTAPR